MTGDFCVGSILNFCWYMLQSDICCKHVDFSLLKNIAWETIPETFSFFCYCRLFGILSLGWKRRLVLHLHGSCGSGIDYVICAHWMEREWWLSFIKILYMPCRYSTFMLLYPTGITSEVGLIYIALPYIKVTILMMQKIQTSFAIIYFGRTIYLLN